MSKHQMETIYRDIPLEKIPWNMEAPPEILQEIVNSSRIKPCKAIELGCGTGNYVMYLASREFDVTGIDFSETAIEIGKNTAMDKGITCHFMVADVLRLPKIGDTFDFAYDWELLHHIYPKERERYVYNVNSLLKQDGYYLSVCFSEDNPQFGGKAKYRKTPLGTILYFSSEKEMISLFKPFFKIEELKTVEIEGKLSKHKAIYAFLRKK